MKEKFTACNNIYFSLSKEKNNENRFTISNMNYLNSRIVILKEKFKQIAYFRFTLDFQKIFNTY